MKKSPQNSMTKEQIDFVAEKLADFFCNLFQNHPEFLTEYAKQPRTPKRPK